MNPEKASDNRIRIFEPKEYDYDRLLKLKEVREHEVILAQRNLTEINELISQADSLGVKSKEKEVIEELK